MFVDYKAYLSADYCKRRFECYGAFASLPLEVTVVTTMDSWFRRDFFNGVNRAHEWTAYGKAHMERFISRLDFEYKELFTIDDYQLFLPMHCSSKPLDPEQVKRDREQILAESSQPLNMTKGHAYSMLKAVGFWKVHYNTKYREWMDRWDIFMGYDPATQSFPRLTTGSDLDDEGYVSWSDDSE
jgi:hypothetical protein